MPASDPRTRVLAIALPAVVLVGSFIGLSRPSGEGLSPHARHMEAMLEADPPDVVLLGDSMLDEGIDAGALAAGLGSPSPAVAKLSVQGSRPPLWYAVLDNRVYGNGHMPEVVVVAGRLDQMLMVSPRFDDNRGRLLGQIDEDDTLIMRKSLRAGPLALAMRSTHIPRARTRTWLLDTAMYSLLAAPGPEWRARGGGALDGAVAEVFGGDDAVDFDKTRRVIPIVQEEMDPFSDGAQAVPVEESFLPDLVALALEHGSTIVFVHLPISPASMRRVRVTEEELDAAMEVLDQPHVGFYDLSGLGLSREQFKDGNHANASGRRVITEALADRLAEDGLLDGGRAHRDTPGPVFEYERIGVPHALPPLGRARRGDGCSYSFAVPRLRYLSPSGHGSAAIGKVSPVVLLRDGVPLAPKGTRHDLSGCDGLYEHVGSSIRFSTPEPLRGPLDTSRYQVVLATEVPHRNGNRDEAWWVYPGTALRISSDAPWTADQGDFRVTVLAAALGRGKARPTLSASTGGTAPLRRLGRGRFASLDPEPPAGPWSVEVRVPAAGPILALRFLSFGIGDHEVYVVGNDTLHFGASLDLLGEGATAHFAAAPPLVSGVVVDGDEHWLMTAADALSEQALAVGTEARRRSCMPGRVIEQGRPLAYGPCPSEGLEGGASCPRPAGLAFVPSHPDAGGHRLGLDPQRACSAGRWMYPGDALTLRVRDHRFRLGADYLALAATLGAEPGDAKLSVELRVDGKRWHTARAALRRVPEEQVTWEIDRIPAGSHDIELTVHSTAQAPLLLLSQATLSEHRPTGE